MKHLFATCLLTFLLLLVGNTYLSAQCSIQVEQGCVGACGFTDGFIYTVPPVSVTPDEEVTLCLSNTGTSLCPNTAAGAIILKNNNLVKIVNLTLPGSEFSFTAKAGDVIKVKSRLFDLNNGIECVWLGELYFGLSR